MFFPLPAGGAGNWTHSPTFLTVSAPPCYLQALPRLPPFLLVSSPASLLFQGRGSPSTPPYQIRHCPVESLLTISSGIFFTKFSKTPNFRLCLSGSPILICAEHLPSTNSQLTKTFQARINPFLCLGLHCTLSSQRTLGSFAFLPWCSAEGHDV